jgi:hypothetical protein
MEVEFDLTLEDLIAFNEYHCAHSPAIQAQFRRGWWVVPFWALLVWLILALSAEKFADFAAEHWLWLLIVPFWLFWFPWRWHRRQRKNALRLLNEGENVGVIGRQRLTITPETVEQRSAYREVRMRWEAVEKIVRSEHYAYIYVSAYTAHILPRRAFLTDGEFLKFVGEALHYHDAKRRAAATPPQ